MKSVVTLVLTAALFATATLAAPYDRAFEERFRTKTGRYTAAEEARRLALATKSTDSRCALPGMSCCKREHDHTTSKAPNAVETWQRAKLGHIAATPTTASPGCD